MMVLYKNRVCFLWFIAVGLLLMSCEHPKIFSPAENVEQFTANEIVPALIKMHITGGFAGLNQKMVVRQDGAIEFSDNFPYGHSRSDVLSQAELNDLNEAFLNNRFLVLDDNYLTPNVADFIYYEISYQSSDVHKTVFADYSAAPPSLRKVIDVLNAHIAALNRNGLDLQLSMSSDSLHLNQTVGLQLRATNTSEQPIELKFQDSQRFNFIAYRPIEAASVDQRQNVSTEWQWQQGKDSDTAIGLQMLLPGQTLTFDVEWNGTSETGSRVSGDLWIAGQLIAVPGGATQALHIFIAEK